MTRAGHDDAEPCDAERMLAEHGVAEHGVAERAGAGHGDAERAAAEHGDAEHTDFDCSRARLQLYQYLDGEMEPDDCTKIREHLAHCGPCLKEYDLDQMLKSLVRRSCGCEAAPTELRTQIMSRITTFNVTVEFRD